MPHPLVEQYKFTRSEWLRGLKGVNEEDALKHLGPMNCISWTVGHLAWHEQKYWLDIAQGNILFPELNEKFAFGAEMCSPSLKHVLEMWHAVIDATEPYLDKLDSTALSADLLRKGKSVGQSVGSAMHRITYHYWYHIGEVQAIRQMMEHKRLPVYVGDIEGKAPYRSE